MMKKLYFLLIALTATTFTFGQVVLNEGFDYTTPGFVGGNLATSSDAVGSNNWATHSNTATTGTGTIDVLAGTLSYTGLATSVGNKVLLPGNNSTTPRDINRALSTSSTGAVQYYSLLINVVDNTQLGATGTSNGYFMSFGASAGASVTSLGARLGAISSNSGANYRLNISNISTGTITYTDNGIDLNFGTTYFVVVKYDRSAAPTVATLWVNPSGLGGTEPAATITNSSGTATFASFTSIALRNSSATPKAEIDEIRVGATWADVTPAASAGIQENQIDGFSMYPNPAKNVLNLYTQSNLSKNVQISDVLGKQLVNTTIEGTTMELHLQTGIYIIKVEEAGKVATQKLVIE